MGVAHLVGGTARRIGRDARELDPAHRRDGVAFLLVALALIVAAREWWGIDGSTAEAIHVVAAGTFGEVAVAVPLILLALAVRLMRHPDREQANSRVTIGLSAMTVAVCSIVHIASGRPQPSDGYEGLRDAGGIVGYLVGHPLAAGLSAWVAVPLLVLLAFFGLLVVTKTPVHAIPERLGGVYNRLTGHEPGGQEPTEKDPQDLDLADGVLRHDGTDEVPKPSRRRVKSPRRPRAEPAAEEEPTERLEGGYVGDEAFERAAALEREMLETAHEAAVAPPADPPTEVLGTTDRPADAPVAAAQVPMRPLPAPPTTRVPRGEQPMLDGDTVYVLPGEDLLVKGAPHKVRSAANDRIVEALTGVFDQFDIAAKVTGFSRGRP